MKFLPKFMRRTERRNYSDIALQAFMTGATGEANDAGRTAALEAVSSLLARDLMDARVSAAPWAQNAISPQWRAMTGRSLIRAGASMSFVEMSGEMELIPCADWDWLEGGLSEDTWTARVTAYGPVRTITRRLSRDSLVWVTWGASPRSRHRGAGPLSWASSTGRLAGAMERHLGDELTAPHAYTMPLPDGDSTKMDAVADSLGKARGGLVFVPTTAGGFEAGRGEAPHRDWIASRLGANPPAALVELARDAFDRALAACGCPPALFQARADGTAQREALRRWHLSVVRPVAGLLAHELTQRLDTPVTFQFDNYAVDLQSRATSFKQLVANGVEIEKALAITGLLADDD